MVFKREVMNLSKRLSSFLSLLLARFFGPPSLPVCAPAHSPIHAQRGASMVEYALLVALVALIAIPSVKMLGTGVSDSFYKAEYELAGAGTFPAPCQFGSPNYPGCL